MPRIFVCYCPAGKELCECSGCFMLNSAGLCDASICPSFQYNNASGTCGVDKRPKQLTAFLLSFFLSSVGAANFYIHRNGLGELATTVACTDLFFFVAFLLIMLVVTRISSIIVCPVYLKLISLCITYFL